MSLVNHKCMEYCVKASDRLHLAVLLRILEEHDVVADSVDTEDLSFHLNQLNWWLFSDLYLQKAEIEPPYVW